MSWITDGDSLWPINDDTLRELWIVYWSECVIQASLLFLV